MNIIVTGSLGYDYIMNFPGRFADRIMADKIHKISLGFLADRMNKQFGGTAVNISYSMKLLGLDPIITAPAGNDFGPYELFLKEHNLRIDGIKIYSDVTCGTYFVVTDQDDNQIGSYYMGAIKHAKELSFKGLTLVRVRPYENFVVIGPTDPIAMKKYVHECHELKIPYLYDPAFQIDNFTPSELREGIEGADILIANDYEIALIEKKLGISHEELIAMVPILITTLGAKGSIIETHKESIHIKPAKVKNTSDPTGAGDAYRAGFLAGYLKYLNGLLGKDNQGLTPDKLITCGQMGSVAAAYTVETYGTVTHHFTKKEFAMRYKENFGTELVL